MTLSGQYEFLRTPFGLCISPTVFQRYVNNIFRELIRHEFLLVYMDNLIVKSNIVEEGIYRLKVVLDTVDTHGLRIKWSKCHFIQQQIEYLGYRISFNRVQPLEMKTAGVMKFPRPKNVKGVQSFLGLTGYFRKFIGKYAIIVHLLNDLLKKKDNPFVFLF